MSIYKNYISIDMRILSQCVPKIDRFRVSGMLMAVYNSIMADLMEPDLMCEHDKIFEPKNKYEQMFWKSCRELAKKDITSLQKKIEGGKLGGRPKKSVEEMVSNIGNAVSKNEILIDENFNELPDCEYFNAYKKEFSSNEITKMINWLKKVKMGKKVEYAWIGKQFRNFRYRDTGNIL